MIVFSELPNCYCNLGRLELNAYDKNTICKEVGILIAQIHKVSGVEYIEITVFCVKVKYRKQRIGSAMINRLLEYAKVHGISYISVVPGPCDFYDEGVDLDLETQIEIYKKLKFNFTPPKSTEQQSDTMPFPKSKAGILQVE